MSENEKQRPSHRVSFAAFTQDREGQTKLTNAREIGAIWPRKDRDGEGILRFDHTPKEDGVYFVKALDALRGETRDQPKEERTPPRGRTFNRGRDRER